MPDVPDAESKDWLTKALAALDAVSGYTTGALALAGLIILFLPSPIRDIDLTALSGWLTALTVIFGLLTVAKLARAHIAKRKSAMADTSGFRIRLRVRIAKGLTTDARSLQFKVGKKDVTITSQNKEEPLNKAKWIVLNAGGFLTEEVARQFGTRLRLILQLAALSARLGVDVGEDKTTAWVNEEYARSMGLLKDHERIAPNVHGLAILPDDENTRFPLINAEATVTADPEQFLSALGESGENREIDFGPAANAVRLLNLALMTSEPLAQMVLTFSAVEELGQNEKWSEAQETLIEQLAQAAEAATEGTAGEREEVARAIRNGLFPLSLRQGVMRLLSRVGLDSLRKEWDRLYGIRSGIFHGTARLSDSEMSQAALDTVTLCGQIVLAIVAQDGTRVPSVAARQFTVSAPNSAGT
jgi:hypothetical protein